MTTASRKPHFPIAVLFILINALILAGKKYLVKWGIDPGFLIWANLFLLVISLAGFLLQKKGLRSANPNAFVRSVYASMMVKLFITMVVVLVYFFIARSKINKPGLFTAMGLYLVYTVVEVRSLMKVARDKNA